MDVRVRDRIYSEFVICGDALHSDGYRLAHRQIPPDRYSAGDSYPYGGERQLRGIAVDSHHVRHRHCSNTKSHPGTRAGGSSTRARGSQSATGSREDQIHRFHFGHSGCRDPEGHRRERQDGSGSRRRLQFGARAGSEPACARWKEEEEEGMMVWAVVTAVILLGEAATSVRLQARQSVLWLPPIPSGDIMLLGTKYQTCLVGSSARRSGRG